MYCILHVIRSYRTKREEFQLREQRGLLIDRYHSLDKAQKTLLLLCRRHSDKLYYGTPPVTQKSMSLGTLPSTQERAHQHLPPTLQHTGQALTPVPMLEVSNLKGKVQQPGNMLPNF